jgi:predicted RNA-binding Zn-ribbon protein involved in translation (DUF1610 family)
MKRTYSCPKCGAILNPSVKIILRATRGKQKGLFLFSPKPGSYDLITPTDFTLEKGDEVDFACPVCGTDLTSSKGKSWAEIRFSTSPEDQGTVIFSKVSGHHATYLICGDEIRWYGEHASSSINFWGVGPEGE